MACRIAKPPSVLHLPARAPRLPASCLGAERQTERFAPFRAVRSAMGSQEIIDDDTASEPITVVIRLWPPGGDGAATEWRGEIKDLSTGRRMAVGHLKDIESFIRNVATRSR